MSQLLIANPIIFGLLGGGISLARRAFREVLNFAGEETACHECGSDLACPNCDLTGFEECECGQPLVCPNCERKGDSK